MNLINKSIVYFYSLVLCLYSSTAFSEANESWLDGFDNLRLAIDFSVRGDYNFRTNHLSNSDTLGIDIHKVFTSQDGGDFGTLIFQGYLNQLVNAEKFPPFRSQNDLRFICRICNMNFVLLQQNQMNFRIGHYEIPFGLEQNLDTNGTLRQFSNGRDLGGKLDWGVTANGKFSWGGYEFSVSRGVGVEWNDNYSSYIISGRVEKTFAYASFLGFSVYQGHLYTPKTSKYVDQSRLGLDAQTEFGPFTFLAEVSGGKNSSTDLFNSLLEIDIHNNTEKWLAYLQVKTAAHRVVNQHWDSMLQTSLGIKYTPDRHWTLSTQWTQDVENYQQTSSSSVLMAQMRYRF